MLSVLYCCNFDNPSVIGLIEKKKWPDQESSKHCYNDKTQIIQTHKYNCHTLRKIDHTVIFRFCQSDNFVPVWRNLPLDLSCNMVASAVPINPWKIVSYIKKTPQKNTFICQKNVTCKHTYFKCRFCSKFSDFLMRCTAFLNRCKGMLQK